MSLFNPWVLLALISAFLGIGAVSYTKGEDSERERQQLEIAALNAEARDKEQALISAIQTQSTKLQKANQDAKLAQQKRNSDIESGALRLRIPVQTPVCPVHAASDAPAAPRDSVQANAELDREVAKSLIAITDDGDKAIRQLNACIDAYTTVYQTLNKTR
jgi:LAS superfamily LD-carboxypeptidase LdcB